MNTVVAKMNVKLPRSHFRFHFLSMRAMIILLIVLPSNTAALTVPKPCMQLDVMKILSGSLNLESVQIIAQCLHQFYKNNLELQHAGRLHDAVKTIAHDGGEIVSKNPGALPLFGTILITAFLLKENVELYYRAKNVHQENFKDYGRQLDILYEEELKPTLDYINKQFLPNWWNNWAVSTCEVSEKLIHMLEGFAQRLSGLLRNIKTAKIDAKRDKTKAEYLGIGSRLVALGGSLAYFAGIAVVPPMAAGIAAVGGAIGATISRWSSSSLGKTTQGLQDLEDASERLYEMTVRARTQTQLACLEAKMAKTFLGSVITLSLVIVICFSVVKRMFFSYLAM